MRNKLDLASNLVFIFFSRSNQFYGFLSTSPKRAPIFSPHGVFHSIQLAQNQKRPNGESRRSATRFFRKDSLRISHSHVFC